MTDIEISYNCNKQNINDIAKKIGIEDIIPYGNYIGKIDYKKYTNSKKGKLLVSRQVC